MKYTRYNLNVVRTGHRIFYMAPSCIIGPYKHLTSTVRLESKNARSELFIGDEDGSLLRDKWREFVNDG